MSDRPEWFAPKRFGYGAGKPISWQGWVVSILFVAMAVGSGMLFAHKPLVGASIFVPATILFWIVTARTTKGGWRWRWGEDE